jgi:hypothetical protein
MSITDVFNSPVNQWAKTPTLALLQIFKGLCQPNGESTDYGRDGMSGEDKDEVFTIGTIVPATVMPRAPVLATLASWTDGVQDASPELRQVVKMPLAVTLMPFSG